MSSKLRIHCIQHVPFEDAANIGLWARDRGHKISLTRLHHKETFPDLDSMDMLIVMGGLMNVYEYDTYPWLLRERQFICRAMKKQKALLGICLGAQLFADVLGAKVTRNGRKEIGFHQVKLTSRGKNNRYFKNFPQNFTAFQWHGDTFSIPPGHSNLANTKACTNQAFQSAGHILALQFHLEYSPQSVKKMIKNCAHELDNSKYVQPPEQMLADPALFQATKELLYIMMDELASDFL